MLYFFTVLEVKFESPQFESCREFSDGCQSEQELFSTSKWHVRICYLGLLDL